MVNLFVKLALEGKNNMEYVTIQKNIQSSPRKLRLVANMIRKMRPEEALDILAFTNKAAALPLAKAIKTVLANGKASSFLSFKTIEINEGSKLKRYRAGTAGRGRGRPYRRRWRLIKNVVSDAIVAAVKKPNLKTQKMAQSVKSPKVEVKTEKTMKIKEERKEENSKHEARNTKQAENSNV